jgi:hypothetical protein
MLIMTPIRPRPDTRDLIMAMDRPTSRRLESSRAEALDKWSYDRIDEAFISAQIPLDPIDAVRVAIADEPTGANVYVVGSGWGDGCYATYVSWTADGRISSWVTDFRVLPTD